MTNCGLREHISFNVIITGLSVGKLQQCGIKQSSARAEKNCELSPDLFRDPRILVPRKTRGKSRMVLIMIY